MRIKLIFVIAIAAIVGGFTVAFIGNGASAVEEKNSDPNIVVTLKGPGVPVDILDDVVADICFQTDLYDTEKDRKIGTGMDCLRPTTSGDGGSLIDRTTIFNFKIGKVGGQRND